MNCARTSDRAGEVSGGDLCDLVVAYDANYEFNCDAVNGYGESCFGTDIDGLKSVDLPCVVGAAAAAGDGSKPLCGWC